jgi:hypothetical protein
MGKGGERRGRGRSRIRVRRGERRGRAKWRPGGRGQWKKILCRRAAKHSPCSTTLDLCRVATSCIQRHTADAALDPAIRSRLRRSASSAQETCGSTPIKWQDASAPLSSRCRISSLQPPPPFTASAYAFRRFRLRWPPPSAASASADRHECLRLCRPPPFAGSAYLQSSSIGYSCSVDPRRICKCHDYVL